jgi:hydrogenase nickel incorporation protein HypB
MTAVTHAHTDHSLLFIENVGNLVCPAVWDLGEAAKVAILSVTEGEDKPLKYPDMFAASQLMILNKIDLLPHVKFDVARCIELARRVNPAIQIIQLSATTGEGMGEWLHWLDHATGHDHPHHAEASPEAACASGCSSWKPSWRRPGLRWLPMWRIEPALAAHCMPFQQPLWP